MASLALVADYGASSSDSDPDSSDETSSSVKECHFETSPRTSYQGEGVNLLTSCCRDSDDESEEDVEVETPPRESQEKLPLPDIFSSSSAGGDPSRRKCSSSIFANPFKDQEDAKTSILEQHVKMSAAERQEARQRKVCYKFLKGKCRFGDKCKFTHGSSSRTVAPKSAPNRTGANAAQFDGEAPEEGVVGGDDEDEASQTQKRKRAGLGNTLVPPKKAMKAYSKQQRDERPWMNT